MKKQQTTPKTVSKIRLLLVVGIIIAVLGCFGWLQWQIFQVFEAVNDAISFNNSNSNSNSTPGMSYDYSLSRDILIELKKIQADKTGLSTLLALNGKYFYALAMTLTLAFFAALVVAFIAYIFAMAIDELEVRGISWWSTFLSSLVDTLPYILWTILFLSLGLSIFGRNPAERQYYYLYLFSLYVGFGWFLLPFFIQEIGRKFRGARHEGVFDGEGMSGLPDWRIRLRLLRYRFGEVFVRQILYCAIFMMLFDFSLYSVVKTYQPEQTPTVFAQGNQYYEGHCRRIKSELDNLSPSYQKLLIAFAEQVPADHSAHSLVKQQISQTWQILATSNRADLQALIENDERTFLITTFDTYGYEYSYDEYSLPEALTLSEDEQKVIFFEYLADYYIYMNVLILFILFFVVFMLFDMRKLFENA
jgi:hypothetical protein